MRKDGQTDRQTDIHTNRETDIVKIIVTFPNTTNTPKIVISLICILTL